MIASLLMQHKSRMGNIDSKWFYIRWQWLASVWQGLAFTNKRIPQASKVFLIKSFSKESKCTAMCVERLRPVAEHNILIYE
jgi:hypothetical protein